MPKNMIIRLGVDASDFKKKMAQAGMTAESTGQKIKKSLTMSELGSEVRSIMGWGNSSTGISGAIDAGNFEAAKSQLAILKSYRDQLAGAGFDDLQFGEVSERIKLLEFELNAYTETLKATAEAETEAAGDADTLDRSSEKLKRDVRSMNSELDQTSGSLRKIGPSAKSSASNVEGLLKSIRRLGIASLAMRFVRGIFGELGTITRQYISENEALQAQVNGLRSAMGSALAPAINIVTNAMAALMPYVVGVSNAIGSLLGALGGGWANVAAQANGATKAIKGAGGAQAELKRSLQGFDEITKLNSKSSGGGGGGSSGPTVTVEPITPAWLEEFVADMKSKIQAQDWGGVANVIVDGISFGLGAAAGGISRFVKDKLWQPIVEWFNKYSRDAANLYVITDVGQNILWGIGLGISDALKGIGTWIKEHVWKPMVDGFKHAFNIHSPSKDPEIMGVGKNIMLGLLNGFLEPLKDPAAWIKEHVFDPLVSGFRSGAGTGRGAEIDVRANLTSFRDKLRNKWVDFRADFTSWKDNLKNKVVNFQTNLTTWKDNLKGKVVAFQSNLTTWKDSLKDKVVEFKANLTTWQDSLKDKAVTFQSNLTTWKDSLKDKAVEFKSNLTTWQDSLKDKTIAFKSNLTSWKDSLKDKAVDFKSNLTSWKDSLKDKAVNFKSNLTSWSDQLKDKVLTFSADVVKGWTGSLATKLGIGTITSTLNLKTPKISIDWGEVTALGKTYQYPKGFKIRWNEYGAILNGAQLFGIAGNTMLGGGEAGREAVLPLDRHTWWMDDIADRVVAKIGGGSSGTDRPIQINLMVDGKVLTSTVVRNVNAQARATGVNPLAAYI